MEKLDMEANASLKEETELPEFEDKHIISATYTKTSIAQSESILDGVVIDAATNVGRRDRRESGHAKRDLHQLCDKRHWKLTFKCVKEEGPAHMKQFTFEVDIKIRKRQIVCIGYPCSKTKAAAEIAAKGAMWALEKFGYLN